MILERFVKDFRLMFEPERRIWLVFIAVFLVSQMLNMNAAFQDYSGWKTFGFPFSYFQYHDEAAYSYFDVVNLLIDMVILFIVSRIILFGYAKLTQYKIIK